MLDPRTIAMMQFTANQNAARRSGKSGPRLLDDAENNVGNATILEPEILPPGQGFTVIKQSNPPRVLNLTAESNAGQSITVVMTAARAPGLIGLAGPITGVIEFGNGTQSTQIEFDIPIGAYIGNLFAVEPGSQPQDSGAAIQVPTGIVRAYARYDNAYITPNLEGFAFGGPGSLAFPLFPGAGPFAPNTNSPVPVNIKAFANYFGRHHSKLYKTQYLYVGDITLPQPFDGTYCIPAFAKSVQVVPDPPISMTIRLIDPIPLGSPAASPVQFKEQYVIPASTYPVIPIEGNATLISVTSTAGGSVVTGVKLVYEIGF